jgi:4-diphosphocytidyl-2-C-methyl-D-erythritol kinase
LSNSPERLRVCAPAKINLCLHVGARRPDGFHDLQSAVVFVEAGDVLLFEAADELSLVFDGRFAGALKDEPNNLVLKAAGLFAERESVPPRTRIALTKNLPVASGIGGGSADAAATLRGLAALWRRTAATLELATDIGSDVPVCLLSRPAWMEGRGERIAVLGDVPPLDLVLVNPGIAVSTAGVFRGLERRSGVESVKPGALNSLYAVRDYLSATNNDLEAPALALAPPIGDVLATLRSHGAIFARMSGSGATCFGLFENGSVASAAADAIATARPGWWVTATRIAGPDIGTPQMMSQ